MYQSWVNTVAGVTGNMNDGGPLPLAAGESHYVPCKALDEFIRTCFPTEVEEREAALAGDEAASESSGSLTFPIFMCALSRVPLSQSAFGLPTLLKSC